MRVVARPMPEAAPTMMNGLGESSEAIVVDFQERGLVDLCYR